MEILNKTIKKLSEEQYQELLTEVAGNKKNKPFMVLETARTRDVEDSEMMEMLQVNPSTYYTLKSRLNTKIAAILSKNVQNPISVLMDEVARVPANLYSNNREFSIRALKELEKQLAEYDLSSELIIVYKTLATLYLHSEEDYRHYEQLYSKHVAYSLAVAKAESLFYQFIRKAGIYQLTLNSADLEEMIIIRRELSNITELYKSHRLFVINNIVRIYFNCIAMHKREGLKSRELEVENLIKEMDSIFEKYPLDTFYQNIKFLTGFMYFEYYSKVHNTIRADFYLQRINEHIGELAGKHVMAFFITQFMESKTEKYLDDSNLDQLCEFVTKYSTGYDVPAQEPWHFIAYRRHQAICKFYQRDYSGAARVINDLRNTMSLKHYVHTDIECKLFQALNYCIVGEDSLCTQLIASLKRQIREHDEEYESTRIFIKILKAAMKPADYRKKIKRIMELWNQFTSINTGNKAILRFVRLDEQTIRKMTNPLKEE